MGPKKGDSLTVAFFRAVFLANFLLDSAANATLTAQSTAHLTCVRLKNQSIAAKVYTVKKRPKTIIMKQPNSASRGKKSRKTREELNQESRDRKRQKKHRGNAAGSRASGSENGSQNRSGNAVKDERIGSKKPIPLGRDLVPAPVRVKKPKSEKPMTPKEELELLENDERLDQLLERLEEGGTLNAEEQTWVDVKLDRIDELMQKLGLSYDDSEDEDDEDASEDMMRLLKGGQ